ncbi:MAG TPA: VWA domain-containing protein [Syntrophales bacterium]|nr:VWA domain-containing protein [Syntrophales bacterium]HOL59058.1 VWA domain-containing protein [Syntrophales bacterium]
MNRGLLEDESRRLEEELYLYGEERAAELKELVLLVATYDPGLAWEYFRNGHRIMGLSDPQIPVKLAALGCAVWQREPMMAPYVIREAVRLLSQVDFEVIRMITALSEVIARHSATYARRVWEEAERSIEALKSSGVSLEVLLGVFRLLLHAAKYDWNSAFRLMDKIPRAIGALKAPIDEEVTLAILSQGEKITPYGGHLLEAYMESACKVFARKNIFPAERELILETVELTAKKSPTHASALMSALPGYMEVLEEVGNLHRLREIFDFARILAEKSGQVAEGFVSCAISGIKKFSGEDLRYICETALKLVSVSTLLAHAFLMSLNTLWGKLDQGKIDEVFRLIREMGMISPEVAVRLTEITPRVVERGGIDSWRLFSAFSLRLLLHDKSAATRFLERVMDSLDNILKAGGQDLLEETFRRASALAEMNARVATSFFEHSTDIYRVAGGDGLGKLADIISGLGKDRWSIAMGLLSEGAPVMERIGLPGLSMLTDIAVDLASRESYGATTLLNKAPEIIDRLEDGTGELTYQILKKVREVARINGRIALSLFEVAPQVKLQARREGLEAVMEMAFRIASKGNAGKRLIDLSPIILERMGLEGWEAMGRLVANMYPLAPEEALHAVENCPFILDRLEALGEGGVAVRVYDLANEAGALSAALAINIIEKSPQLIEWLGVVGLELVVRHLIEIAKTDEREALAILSAHPETFNLLATGIPPGVAMKEVKPVLTTYLKALLGRRVDIVEGKHAATDGEHIYLPPRIRDFTDWEDNFRLYKVLATFEEARLQWGGWLFSWRKLKDVVEYVSKKYGKVLPEKAEEDDLTRFCHLFDEPVLIRDLIEIMENYRLEQILLREYPGLKKEIEKVNRHQAKKRMPPEKMLNLKRRVVETIARGLMAGVKRQADFCAPVGIICQRAWEKAEALKKEGSDIHDSARVAVCVYEDITAAIKDSYRRRRLPQARLKERQKSMNLGSFSRASRELERHLKGVPAGSDRGGLRVERESMEKGDSAPMEQPASSAGGITPGRKGASKTWRGREAGMKQEGGKKSAPGEAAAPFGLYSPEKIERILKSVYQTHGITPEEVERRVAMMLPYEAFLFVRSLEHALDSDLELEAEPGTFLYPEWGEDISGYRSSWVRVREHMLTVGNLDFYREVMEKHRGLVKKIRREFQLLRPDSLRRRKRERDGSEIDLDAVVDYLVDCRLKLSPREENYIMSRRSRRDIAVAFLVDMSRSTKGAVIDREKEALIVMSEALNEVGDAFAIFGFSGDNRDNVDFYIIKAFDEPYGDRVKGRISVITDQYENRDGAAIRHVTSILRHRKERARILILISDGKPVDKEYHGTYAVEDTRMALKEAYREGIRSFCITVDREAADYLPRMYSSSRWIVIDDVSKLPERITGVYRMLTA